MTRRRTSRLLAAAVAAWALLATGVLAAAAPAGAAVSTVTVTVTLQDTTGAPVAGWQVVGRYGPDEDDEDVDTTDAAGVAHLLVPADSTVQLWSVTRTDGNDEVLTVDAGPAGTSTVLIQPTTWSHTYRVVDPAGRPVSNATVRTDVLVSTEVSNPEHGDYRFRDITPWRYRPPGQVGEHTPGVTGIDGRTEPMTWYEPEPDPAIACPLAVFPERCDQDDDGVADGMFVELAGGQGYPYATGTAVPYTDWVVPGTGTITLPVAAVPIVDVVRQRPGKRTGEVVLTVRVRKPSGSGYVPAPKVSLDAGIDPRNVDPDSDWRTDAQGLAELHYWRLARPTTVAVTGLARAAVAATVTLQPKLGVGVAQARYNPPGKDTRTRKGLNREWISFTNTSAAPVSMKRWTVTNKAGNRYRFSRLILRPGATVTLHTGPGKDTKADRYWGSKRHRWTNRDKATLRRPGGAVAATCDWYGEGGTRTCLV